MREQLEADLSVEVDVVDRMRRAIPLARSKGDITSAKLFEEILADEEHHVDYLETQIALMDSLGEQLYLAQLVEQPSS